MFNVSKKKNSWRIIKFFSVEISVFKRLTLHTMRTEKIEDLKTKFIARIKTCFAKKLYELFLIQLNIIQ